MTRYSVKQLSKLAGVSIRTLHHYDRIGLLKPSFRSEKNYRYYERPELEKLQQILFYRELDIPLGEIAEILHDPDFDRLKALEQHRTMLRSRAKRLKTLLTTIDKTISNIKNNSDMLTDKEMYEGFTSEQVESMRQEVIDRWGEKELQEAEERIRKMGSQGWQDHKAKGEEISQMMAELMDLGPGDPRVQQTVALHYRYIGQFYEVSEERYRGLGKLYVEDERFTAYYEKFREGLAAFMQKAMDVFCDNEMKTPVE